MLRKEQNDLLTQTGPGTPMGAAVPPPLAAGAAGRGTAGERLPAGAGEAAVGAAARLPRHARAATALIDEFCAHRGVSLWFGRNEECGLRCPYHGWKYDVTGQCIEVPSEPAESGFCKKIKLKSYPLVERGGVLWTYMGPPEKQPPLPEWEFAMVPAEPAASCPSACRNATGCRRWKAASIPATSPSCTRGELEHAIRCSRAPRATSTISATSQPVFEVVESPGGLYIGARRNAENGNYYWRITQWVMPSFTMIPPRGDHPVHGHFWVPIDDENCWAWSFDYNPTRPLTDEGAQGDGDGKGIHVKYVPGTFRPLANKDNDYLMDRAAQKAGETYSGVEGIAMQDASLQESMGPIVDRTKENLVSTDNGIIMARHRLLRALKADGEGRDAARRRSASTSACARPPSCCRPTSPSRTRPRTRSWCRPATRARDGVDGHASPKSARMTQRRRGALSHRRAELEAARDQGDRARSAERARGQASGAARLERRDLLHRLRLRQRAAQGESFCRLAQRSRRPHQESDRRSQQRRSGGDGRDRGRERPGGLAHRRGLQPQARDDDGAGSRRPAGCPTRRCRRRWRSCGPGR